MNCGQLLASHDISTEGTICTRRIGLILRAEDSSVVMRHEHCRRIIYNPSEMAWGQRCGTLSCHSSSCQTKRRMFMKVCHPTFTSLKLSVELICKIYGFCFNLVSLVALVLFPHRPDRRSLELYWEQHHHLMSPPTCLHLLIMWSAPVKPAFWSPVPVLLLVFTFILKLTWYFKCNKISYYATSDD